MAFDLPCFPVVLRSTIDAARVTSTAAYLSSPAQQTATDTPETSFNDEMAAINPDGAPGGRLHLLSLPAELQTAIFDLAYQRSSAARLIPAVDWHRNESSRRQHASPSDSDSDFDFDERPFPGPKVSDFLVSKRYFVRSAEAYARSLPLDVDKLGRMPSHFWGKGIIEALATEAVGRYGMCACWKLPSVKTLRLEVELSAFQVDEEGERELPMSRRRLTAQEIEDAPVARKLDHLHGVTRVELTAERAPRCASTRRRRRSGQRTSRCSRAWSGEESRLQSRRCRPSRYPRSRASRHCTRAARSSGIAVKSKLLPVPLPA